MTPEEYERWQRPHVLALRPTSGKSADWPDGPICRTCYERAMRVRDRCPGCGADRLLPGRDPDGVPICHDCVGISRDFFCDRCGFEGDAARSPALRTVHPCPTGSPAFSTMAAARSPRSCALGEPALGARSPQEQTDLAPPSQRHLPPVGPGARSRPDQPRGPAAAGALARGRPPARPAHGEQSPAPSRPAAPALRTLARRTPRRRR